MRKLLPGLSLTGILFLFSFISFGQKDLDTSTLRLLLHKYAGRLHISATDADNAVITNTYFEKQTGIQYVYLQQAYQQVNVFNSVLSLSFRNGSLVYASGKFIDSIAGKAGVASPSVTA